MKFNYNNSTDKKAGEQFYDWLQAETKSSLASAYGNGEQTKAAIFLFVNRAYESHMPEDQIAKLFGTSIVRAGYREADEEPAFFWLEEFAHIAKRTHGRK